MSHSLFVSAAGSRQRGVAVNASLGRASTAACRAVGRVGKQAGQQRQRSRQASTNRHAGFSSHLFWFRSSVDAKRALTSWPTLSLSLSLTPLWIVSSKESERCVPHSTRCGTLQSAVETGTIGQLQHESECWRCHCRCLCRCHCLCRWRLECPAGKQ